MKKVLLVITLILTLIGCGISKNKLEQLISSVSLEISCSNLFLPGSIENRNPSIISTQKLLNITISELEEIVDNIGSEGYKDKEQITLWINTLKNINIDFAKDNILIYTFVETSICDYKENHTLINKKKIDIIFKQTSQACDAGMILYYLAYKVSKDIEEVSIKAFEKKAVLINM